MSSRFLREAFGVVALPAFPFSLQSRSSQGVLWDQERQEIVVEAMHAISAPPQRQEVGIEAAQLTEAALRALAEDDIATVEEPAIFGGSLLRHFGHFCHESLGRLWWLSREDATPAPAQAARRRLHQQNAHVYFFMPTWLDCGKDLLPYMAEILTGLGLRPDRIRILDRPIRFQHLLIPVQSWGFLWDRQACNAHLGCDSRALMRSLLTSFRVPADPQGEAAPTRLYVSRSGLPLNLGRLIGDRGLDHLMAAAGYTIFHPERHDIATQIRFYSQANDIVFMDGSSLYLLWFTRLQPGARISVILRRRQGHEVCARLHELLPDADRIHWRLLDELLVEELTSDRDWESHNLADFGALARQLAPAIPFPSEEVKRGLEAYARELVRDSSQEQVIGIVQGLLAELVLNNRRQESRRERVVAAFRHRLRRLRRRLTSP